MVYHFQLVFFYGNFQKRWNQKEENSIKFDIFPVHRSHSTILDGQKCCFIVYLISNAAIYNVTSCLVGSALGAQSYLKHILEVFHDTLFRILRKKLQYLFPKNGKNQSKFVFERERQQMAMVMHARVDIVHGPGKYVYYAYHTNHSRFEYVECAWVSVIPVRFKNVFRFLFFDFE